MKRISAPYEYCYYIDCERISQIAYNGFRRITQIALIIIREICLISFNPLFEKNPINPCNLWSLL